MSVPWALHGFVHERNYSIYKLMWLNLIGGNYRMPIDTPQPLLVLRAGLTSEVVHYVVAAAVFSALAVVFGRLAKAFWDRYELGLLGFALVLAGNTYVLSGPLLNAYWPVVYYSLIVTSALLFAKRRYAQAFALIGLSGVLRPESWGFAVGLWALLFVTDREAWRPVYGWALLAVPAWLLFDYFLAGDPLYSYETVTRYQDVTGAETVTWTAYWPRVISDITNHFSPILLGLGLVGIGSGLVSSTSDRERQGHLALALLIGLSFLGYWAVSVLTDIVIHVRFLSLAAVLLLFYAATLPASLGRAMPRLGELLPAHRAGRLAVTGLWAAAVLVAGHPMEAWKETRETSRTKRVILETREGALNYLKKYWVAGTRSLITGRSIEIFELQLGEAASRRMHQLRVVATYPERLKRIAPGTAVLIQGDDAGHAVRFNFLGREGTHQRYGVTFRPQGSLLGPDDEPNGIVYRFDVTGTE